MRILYTMEENVSPEVMSGGQAVMWHKILNSLVRANHHVTLLVPKDYVGETSLPLVRGNYSSTRLNKRDYMESIYGEFKMGGYDRVVSNGTFQIKYDDAWKEMASILRVVIHMRTDRLTGGFTLPTLQALEAWCLRGTYVASVSPDHLADLEKMRPITSSPYYVPTLPTGIMALRENFRRFNILSYDEETPSPSPGGGFLVHVSRLHKEKLPLFSCKVARELGIPLRLYHPLPTAKGDKFIKETIPKEFPEVMLVQDATREEILMGISSAIALINPSSNEASSGLVPFEAISCGTPLVYSLSGTHTIAKDFPLTKMCPRRTVKSYVGALRELVAKETIELRGEQQFLAKRLYSSAQFDREVDKIIQ